MIDISYFERDLELIRKSSPLIHNITNYVVMNNTANALLAIGASPVMAHAIDEVADMASIASALVINIGTLDTLWVESMLKAGKTASLKDTPIVFDPVGAGATPYRTAVSKQIIVECKPTIIRGNASEIMALCLASEELTTKGVDSAHESIVALDSAKLLAQKTGAIVVISGDIDYITDGDRVERVANGSTLMTRVTGMGCTATAIVAAFAAVNDNPLEAATHAMLAMGIAGERAAAYSKGNGSMQLNFLDELFNLDAEAIQSIYREVKE